MVAAVGEPRVRRRARRRARRPRGAGMALVAGQPGGAGVGAVQRGRCRHQGQRRRESEGSLGAACRALRGNRLRAARRAARREAHVRRRRHGRRDRAAPKRDRPEQRGRVEAGREDPPRGDSIRREAIRRRAAHPRCETRRCVLRRVRGLARRHPRSGGPNQRSAHGVPDRAHQARRQEPVSRLHPGKARLDRRTSWHGFGKRRADEPAAEPARVSRHSGAGRSQRRVVCSPK